MMKNLFIFENKLNALTGHDDGVLLPSPKGRGTEGEGAAYCHPELGCLLLLQSRRRCKQNGWFPTGSIHLMEKEPTGIDRFRPRGQGHTLRMAQRFPLSNKFGMTDDSCEKANISPLPLGEGGTECRVRVKKTAFTLAEVLITLGIIGVVAAITLPTLMNNVQEKMRKEQVRTIKYKLTQATDKMKSLNLIGPYATTEDFVNELKKHFKISKICDNSNLRSCWPTEKINTADGEVSVSSLTNGTKLKALAHGTASTQTMGIVTGDGTAMILAYSPVCDALNPERTYLWSTVDNKPETNATTNCISAIFDINGSKKPNKVGTDVRTLNSLFGSKQYSATSITKDECNRLKTKLGINGCYYDTDYWAGAVKKCHDIGMHLPSMQTLATIAGAKYGRTDIDVYTLIMRNDYSTDTYDSTGNCLDYFKAHDWGRLATSNVICVDTLPSDVNSSIASLAGDFWSSSEVSASTAQLRYIASAGSSWHTDGRKYNYVPLCVGD